MEPTLRILMVEDSVDDAELVMRFVRQGRVQPHWYRVDSEPHLRNALITECWDLVISDYNLPVFSGPEAIRLVRESNLDIPLIVVSGTVGEDLAIETLKLGATDYVLKSNLSRLPSAIDRALREVAIQREKRVTEQQLIQAQKMESIGRLAGGVAHDVNNVLAAITLQAEMALEEIQHGEYEKALKSLDSILKAEESAAAIVRQLLAFSRQRVAPVQMVDFNNVLSGMSALITPLIGEDIEVTIQPAGQPLYVLADKSQLEQIILNLAVNARDAMPHGGKLSLNLKTETVNQSQQEMRLPISPGRYVVFSVTDTGEGIPAQVLSQIFDPFFTTKEPGKGTGLGLSVIYGILRQAGGSVSVLSTPGKGTTFIIYWPEAMNGGGQVAEPPKAEVPTPKRALGSASILLVEDEPVLREILMETLANQGHSVITAKNGEDAFKIVQENTGKISLMIVDMILPKMNGATLVEKSRKLDSGISVIFLSGYSDVPLQLNTLGNGNTWFLEKPFSSAALIKKVSEVLDFEPAKGSHTAKTPRSN